MALISPGGIAIDMRNIILRIDSKADGAQGGYPVALFADEGGAEWNTKPVAVAVIPEEEVANASERPPVVEPSNVGSPAQGPASGNRDARPVSPGDARLATRGRQLFDLVFRDEVRREWDRLSKAYPRQQEPREGRRLILEIGPEALHRLPWELMNSLPEKGLWLARDPLNSMVRGPIQFGQNSQLCDWPIRLMVIVGSVPGDLAVQAETEVEALERRLWKMRHLIELRILKQKTRQQIVDEYADFKPQIFHFIGHGVIAQQGQKDQSYLLLEGQDREATEWTIERIFNDLAVWEPNLVFINACHSHDRAGREGVWSIADTFFQIGARAVIGMQGAIRGTSAAFLADQVYSALTRIEDSKWGWDLALTEARRLLEPRSDAAPVDWSLPYLRLIVPPDQTLPIRRVASQSFLNRVRSENDFGFNPVFIDREAPRRQILKEFVNDPKRVSHLCLIEGQEEVGKSHLIKYCLEACICWGHPVKYVSLAGNATLDFTRILEAICAGEATSLAKPPLPTAPFRRIRPALLDAAAAAAPVMGRLIPTKDEVLATRLEQPAQRLCELFLDALAEAVAEMLAGRPETSPPLVLVLDQLTGGRLTGGGGVLDEIRDILLPHLIKPLAVGQIKNLILIIAVPSSVMDRLPFQEVLSFKPPTIRVPEFQCTEFGPLASEYFRRGEFDDPPRFPAGSWEESVQHFERQLTMNRRNWKPSFLNVVAQAVLMSSSQGGDPWPCR